MTGVVALDGVVRHYEWGSRTAIPSLLGVDADGQPWAELWFGAHQHDPSPVPDRGTTLDALLASDPQRHLGSTSAVRFDGRLPYLMKVLAADRALSIQVHPTLEQARAGFAREEAQGIPQDAPHRNYKDANHKPELLCALTPFDALCGFRPVPDTIDLLAELALPDLGFLADRLRGDDPLRAAFTAVLEHPDIEPVVAALTARVAGAADGPLYATRLGAQDAPGDVGVVLTLLLNYVRLAPGEAIYLGAGNVHAYLRGTGVEIMASSDNVLRCGLTPKHIDVPELLRITDFTSLADPLWPAVGGRFEMPVHDFALTRIEVDGSTGLHDDGPCIVLCTSGSVSVGDVPVRPGHAAFVPAGEAITITGVGEVFVASTGR
ncbi:MAG: mannose-6-phosphate isomerase [Pseudonocardiales bacterium]|nr:mannose-6-phosphate isomerase [Pseudonocardiales bacterium]